MLLQIEESIEQEPVVRLEGLRKSFNGREVLSGINLDVMPGQVVTIIGASGSGKSTLLRCINLLEVPDAGHVWFRGTDLAVDRVNVNALRERIGMVFQGFNLFPRKITFKISIKSSTIISNPPF